MYGPIWIDPRFFDDRPGGWWGRDQPWTYRKVTTTTAPYSKPVTEDRIREIVREEIADLPIPFDVPDAPPES